MNSGAESEYVVYGYRWIALTVFVTAGISNALILLTWSPISDKASDYWNNLPISLVNLLAVIFQAVYLPGTMLSLKAMHTTNLRQTMLLGGSLTASGCCIRYLGAMLYDANDISATGSYVLVLLGTAVVALAQPFYLNMPAKIASTWFSIKERDLSTTLCSLANPLGSALGSVLPAMFVSGGDNDDEDVKGVSNLLLVQLLVAASTLAATVFLFRNAPKTPPSASAQEIHDEGYSRVPLKEQLSMLFSKPEYVKLLFAFTIALGQLNALAALINQLPGDYSNGESGSLGAVLILCGFMGAFLTGFLLNHLKAYMQILQGSYFLATLSILFFVSNCHKGNFPLLLTSAALLGLTLLPVIPSTIINAVEYAYPVSEDLSVGTLYVAANTAAIGFTFVGQGLLSLDSLGPAPLFPYGLWMIGTFLLGLLPLFFLSGKYLRMEKDTLMDDKDETVVSLLHDT